MIKVIFIILAAGIMQQAAAQTLYKAANIPSELKTRANAVLRDMETTVDMRSPENVVISVKKVITVLNKNGDSDADFMFFITKTRS